ncbi:hypothetical protein MYY16_002557, partial [Enterococcus faecalis]|nr:hypothetical protein [Enterococcus faecalis]
MSYVNIWIAWYILIVFFILGLIALSFPELMFVVYFSTEKAPSEMIESLGKIKDIAALLQSHILPLHEYLKVFMLIVIVLIYLGINVYIKFKMPLLFKINNCIRVIVYGIVIYYFTQPPGLRDFIIFLFIVGTISILSKIIL